MRIKEFENFFYNKQVMLARSYEEAIILFDPTVLYELVFIDNNIVGSVKTGLDFVLHFKTVLLEQRVIIHSSCFKAGEAIKKILPNSLFMPLVPIN